MSCAKNWPRYPKVKSSMFDFIYIEEEVAESTRAKEIISLYPNATVVTCDRYTEIFNRHGQNFRLQKRNPALLIGAKHGRRILETPDSFGIGSNMNFYFSHMLNCLYDCRYCFLQGMYQSGHMVLFLNYDDFKQDIEKILTTTPVIKSKEIPHFFTGYDCDSLAMEHVTNFVENFLPFFAAHPRALFELRTKSVRIASLINRSAVKNVVVAYSLTPEQLATHYERGVPSPASRIAATAQLQDNGWTVGLRFDPLIYHSGYQDNYRQLFNEVFSSVCGARVHSVSLGTLRLPRAFHRRIETLYPEEALFAQSLEETTKNVGYPNALRNEMMSFCSQELEQHVPKEAIFTCDSEFGNNKQKCDKELPSKGVHHR